MEKIVRLLLGVYLNVFCLGLNAQVEIKPSKLDFISKTEFNKYYELVNAAELFIVEKQYGKALKKYKKANKIRQTFQVDSKKAVQCAINSNNFEKSLPFLNNLFSVGYTKKYFEDKIKYQKLVDSKIWKKVNEEKIDKLTSPNLVLLIDSLYKIDQEFRYDNLAFVDTIIKIDSMIFDNILEVVNSYNGLPSEEAVFNKNSKGWSNYDIILIHQTKNHPVEMKKILFESMLKGRIRNTDYEFHSKNFIQNETNRLNCMQYTGGLFLQLRDELYTCCCEEEASIDKNRKKVGLCSTEDIRKKAVFQYEESKDFRFGGFASKYGEMSHEKEVFTRKELLDMGMVLYKRLPSEKAYYKR